MDVETILCTPVKGAGGGAPSDDVVLATPGSGTPGRWHGARYATSARSVELDNLRSRPRIYLPGINSRLRLLHTC
jgi:hypothetical protein